MASRAADVQFLPFQLDAAARDLAVLAKDRRDQLGAPRPHQAGDAQDFAAPQVECDAVEHFAAGLVGIDGLQVGHLEHHLAGLAVAAREALLHLTAHHVADQFLLRERLVGCVVTVLPSRKIVTESVMRKNSSICA
jgi:hypothetical protein